MSEVQVARLPRMLLPQFAAGALVEVEGSGYWVGYDADRLVGAVYSPGRPEWRGGWTISQPIELPAFLELVRSIGIEVVKVPAAWALGSAVPRDGRGH